MKEMIRDLMNNTKKVENVLKKYEDSRNNDDLLYLHYCEEYYTLDLNNISIKDFFINRKNYNFPNYETLSRMRRKIQSQNPDLIANNIIKEYRKNAEKCFIEYSKI